MRKDNNSGNKTGNYRNNDLRNNVPSNSVDKKKTCPFRSGKEKIDYKDPRSLQKYISDHGKMMPNRVTMASAKYQRELAVAIKRARFLALLPYVAE